MEVRSGLFGKVIEGNFWRTSDVGYSGTRQCVIGFMFIFGRKEKYRCFLRFTRCSVALDIGHLRVMYLMVMRRWWGQAVDTFK